MHNKKDITKNILQLQEESKKRSPEIYRDCEDTLEKLRAIQDLIDEKMKLPVQDEETMLSIHELSQKYDNLQLRPFAAALRLQKKVQLFVYDTLHSIIGKNILDDKIVIMLVDSLMKHLNESSEQGIKIFQLLYYLINYSCIKGEIIMNVFYSLISIVQNETNISTNAKVLSKQVVHTIFSRIKNTDLQNADVNNEFINDLKGTLNDIYELIKEKGSKFINVELSIDYIEIILRDDKIFDNADIREIFVKIIKRVEKVATLNISSALRDKYNNIIFRIIKSPYFIEESKILIERSENYLQLFEDDVREFIIINEPTRFTFFQTVKKQINNQNIQTTDKYMLIFNVFKTLTSKVGKASETQDEPDVNSQPVNDTSLFSRDIKSIFTELIDSFTEVYILFLTTVPLIINEEDNLIDIFSNIIPLYVHEKETFKRLIEVMVNLKNNFSIECFKICVRLKSFVTLEWKILFKYINANNDQNCLNYLLEYIDQFTPDELFFVINFIDNPQNLLILNQKTIKTSGNNICCIQALFCELYYNTPLLCSSIKDFYGFTAEHDEESEILPFLFIYFALNEMSLTQIYTSNDTPSSLVSHFDRLKAMSNFKDISTNQNTVTEENSIELLNVVYSSIEIINDKIHFSWDIIFKILDTTVNLSFLAEENFKLLQMISENLYPLIPQHCVKKIPGLFYKISQHELNNVTINLQILNLINDNVKHVNDTAAWREYLTHVVSIVKRNRKGWNDIFETGVHIIFTLLRAEAASLPENEDIIFGLVLTELIVIAKDLFFNRIMADCDINFEEKRRNKDTLIILIEKINTFVITRDNPCVDDYYRFIVSLITFKHDLNERGMQRWKDDLALKALDILDCKKSLMNDSFILIMENIPLHEDEKLYYDTKVLIKLFNSHGFPINQNLVLNHIERFFAVTNIEIRAVIFIFINKFNIDMNLLNHLTNWLKTEDKDLLVRILNLLKLFFKSDKIFINKADNEFQSKELHCEDISQQAIKNVDSNAKKTIVKGPENSPKKASRMYTRNNHKKNAEIDKLKSHEVNSLKNNIDYLRISDNNLEDNKTEKIPNKAEEIKTNQISNDNLQQNQIASHNHEGKYEETFRTNAQEPLLNTKPNKSKICFNNSSHFTNYYVSDDIRKLLKNLFVLIANDDFWEQALMAIQMVVLALKNNKETVEYFMELSRCIFIEQLNSRQENYMNIVTLHKATNTFPVDSLKERRKEKVLIDYISVYIAVISQHLLPEEGLRFIDSSFSLIYDLSFVQPRSYRENLSFRCLEYLFKFTRFTKKFLIKRIIKSLNEYVIEVNIYRDMYSRIKRNEVYQILDNLSDNSLLVNELKNVLIDCLSSKDFVVIEKIQKCLKNGL